MSIVLSIPSAHAHLLAILRYWPDLNLARGDAEVWVRGFTEEQAVQSEVRSIPYISLFREQEGRLIPWGKSLPTKRLPGLLWTPIARAIPVESPDYNHNFFGVAEQITIGLVSHSSPQEAAALKTSFTALKAYVASAPAVRLQELRWVHSSEEQVLIMGHPLPALPGQTYWPLGEHWLPAGYTF
ncbi:MAG TPA: hypothetical protein DCE41_22710, partial [Cytophagales bacterium]|nr:hypothetical protein [Cytophagales bacterium]